MIFLLFSLYGSFQWYSVPGGGSGGQTFKNIVDSREGGSIIEQYGGRENLIKGFIRLDADIFKGGVKVLLDKDLEILRKPENLILLKRSIKKEDEKRYSAVYREGQLKNIWVDLKRSLANQLGFASLDQIEMDRKNLRELFPGKIPPEKEVREEMKDRKPVGDAEKFNPTEEEIVYPSKSFFSFLLLRGKSGERLIPVILNISPADEIIEEVKKLEEEGGEE